MPKIDINKAAEIIKKNAVEPSKLRAIVEEMNLVVQPDPGKETPPAIKKQFVVIISDPEGKLPKDDFVAWVVQIPENESPATTLHRVHRAAYEFNTTKKGRMLPAKAVGDTLENVPAKHFKEAGVWVKTKTPVLVVRTDNRIPNEKDHVDYEIRMNGKKVFSTKQ